MKLSLFLYLIFTYNLLQSQIVINEFQPAPNSDDEEWVELFNNSDKSISINNASLSDLSGKKDIGKIILNPKEYMVVCTDTSKLKLKYKLNGNVQLLQKTVPTQNNTYDAIILKDENGLTLDSAYYDMTWGEKGKSFERFNPNSFGFDRNNWKVCIDSLYGTPCKENSTSILDYDLSLEKLNISKDSINFKINNIGNKNISNVKFDIYADLNNDSIFQINELLNSTNIDFVKSNNFKFYVISKAELRSKTNKSGNIKFLFKLVSDLEMRDFNNSITNYEYISYDFSSLLINEIMFESSSNYSDYVEIYNNSKDSINLNQWQFSNKSDNNLNKTNKIVGDLILAPDSLFIIAYDTTIYKQFPYLKGSKSIYFTKALVLNSISPEQFKLIDPNNLIIDSVNYDKTWHQEFINTTSDLSIEKIHISSLSNIKINWSSCINELGGTPLISNSVRVIYKDTLDFYAQPNPFSPFADGTKSKTKIYCKLPYKSANIILKIYDLNGTLLRNLKSGENAEQRFEVDFDGKNDNGSLLQIGAYIVFLEATDISSGEVYSNKILIAIGK